MSLKENSPDNVTRDGRRSSLAAGYLWTFGSTAFPLVSAFVASLIIARWMGPRVAGLINWTMALATILLIPAKFGIDGAASRLISEYDVSKRDLVPVLLRESLSLRLLFTVPVAIATFLLAHIFARFFKEDALVPLFRTASFLILSVSLNELVALLVIGLNRFRTLFVMRSVMLLLKTGLVTWIALAAAGANGVLAAYTAAALVPALVMFASLFWSERRPAAGAPAAAEVRRRLFRLSAPLAISGASVTIYSLLDKLMIGYFQGASPVGIYSIARNLLETSLFPTFALVMTLRPALAGAWAEGDGDRCRYLVRRSLMNSFFYATCVILVFGCLSGPLVTGIFSDDFAESARILVIFLPLIMMRSLGSVILPGLIAADRAGTYARLTLAGAVLNFILNILLIPRWGAEGAVVSTLISYMPIEVLGLRALWKAMPGFWKKTDWVRVAKGLGAAAAIAAAHRYLAPQAGSMPTALIHAAVIASVYTALVIATGALSRSEFASMLGPVLRRRGR